MSHFASGTWNNPAGLVYQTDALGVTTPPTSGTGGVREGVDLFTYPITRNGHYRVSTYIKVTAVGTGSSNALVMQAAYNDGTARAAATIVPYIGASAPTAATNVTTAGYLEQIGTYYCNTGTNLVVTVLPSGTVTTTGTADFHVAIEAV